jgi:hypothetical protein
MGIKTPREKKRKLKVKKAGLPSKGMKIPKLKKYDNKSEASGKVRGKTWKSRKK